MQPHKAGERLEVQGYHPVDPVAHFGRDTQKICPLGFGALGLVGTTTLVTTMGKPEMDATLAASLPELQHLLFKQEVMTNAEEEIAVTATMK